MKWLLIASVSVSVWVLVIWRITNRRHLEVWRFLIWQHFWVRLSIRSEYRHTSNFFPYWITNCHTSNMTIRNSAGKHKLKLKQKLKLFFITKWTVPSGVNLGNMCLWAPKLLITKTRVSYRRYRHLFWIKNCPACLKNVPPKSLNFIPSTVIHNRVASLTIW